MTETKLKEESLVWSKPSLYNMSTILGLPEHITISTSPNINTSKQQSEIYLINRNIASFTKQKQFFGTAQEVKAKGEKWAKEITGLKVKNYT